MKNIFTLRGSFIAFFVFILCLGSFVFIGLKELYSAMEKVDIAEQNRYESFALAKEITESSAELTKMVRSYVMTGNPEYEKRYWEVVAIGQGKSPRPDGKTIARLALMKEKGFSPEEFAKVSESQNNSFALIKTEDIAMHAMKGLYDNGQGEFTVKGEPNIGLAQHLVNDEKYEAEVKKIMAPVGEFFTLLNNRTLKDIAAVKATAQKAYYVAISLLGAMVVSALIVLVMLYRLIRIQLMMSLMAAEKLAQGDLTIKLTTKRKDELGRLVIAIQGIATGLMALVRDVRTGVETINHVSNEIATGNMDLSSRTERQSANLEETSSSMEELTSTVKQNADNAKNANALVTTTVNLATKGGDVVSHVVSTMGSIKESSSKIAEIITVIDGIAFQTNILALNAAVEAARAGEQGRGFAVVASEVRTLAQRSANAAKEIKSLIDDSVIKVNSGGQLVDQAGVTMSEIVQSVNNVANLMNDITSASEEQNIGIASVGEAITKMDEMTQQNASLVEESANAAKSMQTQVQQLIETVGMFKVNEVIGNELMITGGVQSKR